MYLFTYSFIHFNIINNEYNLYYYLLSLQYTVLHISVYWTFDLILYYF